MNGLAGPGLLAHVLTAKYCDHLPLYRQSGIYARSGVDLERSTLADWVGQCSTLLRPLVEALNRYVLAGAKIHADDTPVPVLAPGEGKTKTGRLWPYVPVSYTHLDVYKRQTHAQTMVPANPQRTADSRFVAPTPTMAPVIVCVVDTGIPSAVAKNSVAAPPAVSYTHLDVYKRQLLYNE